MLFSYERVVGQRWSPEELVIYQNSIGAQKAFSLSRQLLLKKIVNGFFLLHHKKYLAMMAEDIYMTVMQHN